MKNMGTSKAQRSKTKGSRPQRSGSVCCQMWSRRDTKPLALPQVTPEFA